MVAAAAAAKSLHSCPTLRLQYFGNLVQRAHLLEKTDAGKD